MRRRVLVGIFLVCLIIRMAPINSDEKNHPNYLPVPYYNQGNTNWCMISALAMVMRYYGDTVHPWDVANDLNIEGPKDGIRWIEEFPYNLLGEQIRSTVKLKSKVQNYVERKGFSYDAYLRLSEEHIKELIDNEKPVILNYFVFEVDSPYKKEIIKEKDIIDILNLKKEKTVGFHSIIIVGYEEIKGKLNYYIHDPYGRPEKSMLKLVDPDDVEWWSEFQLGCFLLISNNPNPPEAVIFRWNYLADGGDIKYTVHEGSIDSINFSKDVTVRAYVSRNSWSEEIISTKLNVIMLDPITDELQYQRNSGEFEVGPGTVESEGFVRLKASEIESGRYNLWIYLINSENGYKYDKIGPIECTVASEVWYTFILNIFNKIVTFFAETIPNFFRDLVSKDESVEEKAIKEVKKDLDMLSKSLNLISELQESFYESSGEEIPEEYLQFEFKYSIQGARSFYSIKDARNYMCSMDIRECDMDDVFTVVAELDLEQSGFCIVIVDYYAVIADDVEEGRYPVVCDEKGNPFWKSWHLYEEIEERYGEIQQGNFNNGNVCLGTLLVAWISIGAILVNMIKKIGTIAEGASREMWEKEKWRRKVGKEW